MKRFTLLSMSSGDMQTCTYNVFDMLSKSMSSIGFAEFYKLTKIGVVSNISLEDGKFICTDNSMQCIPVLDGRPIDKFLFVLGKLDDYYIILRYDGMMDKIPLKVLVDKYRYNLINASVVESSSGYTVRLKRGKLPTSSSRGKSSVDVSSLMPLVHLSNEYKVCINKARLIKMNSDSSSLKATFYYLCKVINGKLTVVDKCVMINQSWFRWYKPCKEDNRNYIELFESIYSRKPVTSFSSTKSFVDFTKNAKALVKTLGDEKDFVPSPDAVFFNLYSLYSDVYLTSESAIFGSCYCVGDCQVTNGSGIGLVCKVTRDSCMEIVPPIFDWVDDGLQVEKVGNDEIVDFVVTVNNVDIHGKIKLSSTYKGIPRRLDSSADTIK